MTCPSPWTTGTATVDERIAGPSHLRGARRHRWRRTPHCLLRNSHWAPPRRTRPASSTPHIGAGRPAMRPGSQSELRRPGPGGDDDATTRAVRREVAQPSTLRSLMGDRVASEVALLADPGGTPRFTVRSVPPPAVPAANDAPVAEPGAAFPQLIAESALIRVRVRSPQLQPLSVPHRAPRPGRRPSCHPPWQPQPPSTSPGSSSPTWPAAGRRSALTACRRSGCTTSGTPRHVAADGPRALHVVSQRLGLQAVVPHAGAEVCPLPTRIVLS